MYLYVASAIFRSLYVELSCKALYDIDRPPTLVTSMATSQAHTLGAEPAHQCQSVRA